MADRKQESADRPKQPQGPEGDISQREREFLAQRTAKAVRKILPSEASQESAQGTGTDAAADTPATENPAKARRELLQQFRQRQRNPGSGHETPSEGLPDASAEKD